MQVDAGKDRPEAGDEPPGAGRATRAAILHLVLIALLGLISYSNTWHAPFILDDRANIVENPLIRDMGYFLHPSYSEDLPVAGSFKRRFLGYLSFSLNYKINGLGVEGYHIVNTAIHILNAFLVYALAWLTFRTPFLRNSSLAPYARLIALFSGLVFVSHPIETQAVTYIVQRFSSLATFFYLGSVVLYIKSRLSGVELGGKDSMWHYAMSVFLAGLAMKTKEIAITLPLAIALYEFLFFRGRLNRRLCRLSPLFLTALIIPLSFIGLDGSPEQIMDGMDAATRIREIPRLDYLFTEFRVMVTYIRLLLLPVDQSLDYSYPVLHSFADPQVFASFLLLTGIFSLGVYMLRRSMVSEPGLRVVSLGIFWFFTALSVESSIIPLEPSFEHRLYLPSAGAALAFSVAVFYIIRSFAVSKRAFLSMASVVTAILTVSLTYASYYRNAVWHDEVTLWQDVAQKSPRNSRAWNLLGDGYRRQHHPEKAIALIEKSIELDRGNYEAWNNLGAAYLDMHMPDKAIQALKRATNLKLGYAKAWTNLGAAYLELNLFQDAVKAQQTALMLNPMSSDIHYNLGVAYQMEGKPKMAAEQYREALQLDPADQDAAYNLAHISEATSPSLRPKPTLRN